MSNDVFMDEETTEESLEETLNGRAIEEENIAKPTRPGKIGQIEIDEEDLDEDIIYRKKFVVTYTKNGITKAIPLYKWAQLVKKHSSYHLIRKILDLRFPIKHPKPIPHMDLVRYLSKGLVEAKSIFMQYDSRDLALYGYTCVAHTEFPRKLIGSQAETPSDAFLKEVEWRNSAEFTISPVEQIAPGLLLKVYLNSDGHVTAEQSDMVREDENWVYCIDPSRLWYMHQVDRVKRPIPYSNIELVDGRHRAQNYLNSMIKSIEKIDPNAFVDSKYTYGLDANDEIHLRRLCKLHGLKYEVQKEKILKGIHTFEDFMKKYGNDDGQKKSIKRKDLDQLLL